MLPHLLQGTLGRVAVQFHNQVLIAKCCVVLIIFLKCILILLTIQNNEVRYTVL